MRAVGHFAVAVFCTLIGAVCAGQESSSSTPMDVATAKIEAARAVEATRLARTYSSIVDAKQTGDQPWDIE